ncbi:type I-E CRISPR-associated protein Cse2/CasB [Hyphomonas sp.]|uniref:type I-E CRISPR-associated protein Cse2/CasB n=1 Tax=Hyphomonas sp. TaxID=87 RepID=UPI003F6FE07D
MADTTATKWQSPRDLVAASVADWRSKVGYAQNRDSAATARLRRIGTRDDGAVIDVGAAVAIDAFRTLYNRTAALMDKLENPKGLPYHWADKARREAGNSGFDSRLALVAGVLAHVRTDTSGDLGKKLHVNNYSELRFRRLLRLESEVDLMREGRRLVRMLDGDVPVASLARALLFWDAQETRALARSYYDAELFGTSDASTQDKDLEDTDQ